MLKTIKNTSISLSFDSYGGALVDLHLLGEDLNPLEFAFTPEQMPENNRNGAVYQGHFACIGRWGDPSEGEIKRGVPSHGAFANISWNISKKTDNRSFEMGSQSELEGLKVERKVCLEKESPVFLIEETLTNILFLGRPFNIVQHPTICFPFLNSDTVVDCNGKEGFRQRNYKDPEKDPSFWPEGRLNGKESNDLRNPEIQENAIFSYIVDPESPIGWLTCYSPKHNSLLGYVWRREDFPWMHFWTFWEAGKLKYRALEFGTAGIHKPFRELLQTPRIFGVKTTAYIDAGESLTYSYRGFLIKPPPGFEGTSRLSLQEGKIGIEGVNGERISLQLAF